MSTPANSIDQSTTGIVGFTGTGFTATAATQYNVQVGGSSTSTLASIAPSATSGVPLISQGSSSNPTFGTAVVAGGGTGLTSATAYAVLCGGTTSTGAFQSIASVGTSGQVLTSNGAGALPTFQAASGGSSGSMIGVARATLNNTGGVRWISVYSSSLTNTQSIAEFAIPLNGTFSNLYVNIDTNANSVNGTVTVNRNGSNTSIVATVTALTTGVFSDTSHSQAFSAGDTIQFEMSQATTGTFAGTISLKFVPS